MKREDSSDGLILSVVIPTYNEADNIRVVLDKLIESLEESGFRDFEVIVVDDDSPDGTWRVALEYSKSDPRVRVIRRVGERGLASAVLRGAREARGRYILVMDADMQHPPEIAPTLLRKALETDADVVVASRYTRGGGVEGWSRLRLLISRGATLLAHLLVKESRLTSDPMSGFFLARADLLRSSELKPRGYKVLLELLGRSGSRIRVVDVPYVFKRRLSGESKLGLGTITDYVLHLIRLSKLAKFALVGASGMGVNLGVMALLMGLGFIYDAASLAGIEASILSNFLLNEYWTFGIGGGRRLKRLMGYHVSSAGSIIVTYSTMKLLYVLMGVHPLIGQAIGIVLGFTLNYLASSRIIWGRLGLEGKQQV